jgi:DNA-binding ferritin-like protein (Dps family)
MIRTVLLMLKRYKLKKNLASRSLKDFKDIVDYIEMSSLSSIEREVVFQQILDMMLEAQSQGKLADQVIGDDIKGFCDSIIEETNYNKSIFHICFSYIESILQLGLIALLVIIVINLLLHGGEISFNGQNIFYIDIVRFVAIWVAIGPLTFITKRKRIFDKKKSRTGYLGIPVLWIILANLLFTVANIIDNKFPNLATTHVFPDGNIIFILFLFLIAFRGDVCYLLKISN